MTISVLFAAIFLGYQKNYKRMFAYSTIENTEYSIRNSPKNVPKGGVPVTAKDDKSMEAALVLFLINPDMPNLL